MWEKNVKKHLGYFFIFIYLYLCVYLFMNKLTSGNLCSNQSSEIIQNMCKGKTLGLTSWTDKITLKKYKTYLHLI